MCTTKKWKTGILVIAMSLVCGIAKAQHWRSHYRPNRVVTVMVRPRCNIYCQQPFQSKGTIGDGSGLLANAQVPYHQSICKNDTTQQGLGGSRA